MYVVDASIFSSLVIKDEFSGRAESFLTSHGRSELVTVDLAFVETANVLWKHARVLGRIPEESYRRLRTLVVPLIESSVGEVVEAREVIPEALDNAYRFGITVYDSAYVTLALRRGFKLVSFDAKLRGALREIGIVVAP